MPRLILASGSPRRRELLSKAGLSFDIVAPTFDEDTVDPASMPPVEMAKVLARAKAREVAELHPDAVVIGADTFIVFGGEIMGKPHTPAEATRMLGALSGNTHQVITGFCIAGQGREHAEAVVSQVTFKELAAEDIAAYVATGEPLDKAGAYAIQERGSALVSSLTGSVDNVVGLPLAEVLRALEGFGARP